MSALDVLKATVDTIPKSGSGEDESLTLPYFYPTPRFLQALDRSLVIVLGERGTGKTALYRVLAAGGFEAVLDVGGRKLPTPLLVTLNGETWGGSSAAAAELRGADELGVRAWWAGLLVRSLSRRRDLPGEPLPWPDAVVRPLDARDWLPATVGSFPEVGRLLADLDARLDAAGRDLYVVYDDLDRTAATYEGLFGPLRGLLGFWYDHFRRLRRVRPKIFLRTDLFRPQALAFPDASKLFSGHSTELTWDRPSLYAMWAKRLANRPGAVERASRRRDTVMDWIEEKAPLVRWAQAGELGRLPIPFPARDGLFDGMIEGLVGRYMGANPRKGFTYPWLPNHVQDAHGRLAPRAFLGLLRGAAALALGESSPVERVANPLRPAHLQSALDVASRIRIQELAEEDTWIDDLSRALDGLEVPAGRSEWLERLVVLVGRDHLRLPSNDPEGLLEHLVVRGLVERRTDGRFNVPDIYLFGLGMKRRGGVRRAG